MRVVKRTVVCALLLALLGGLSGCFLMSDEQRAEHTLKAVLHALGNEDKEEMKELFSVQAIENAEDFEYGVQYAMDFFQGEVLSWEVHVVGAEGTVGVRYAISSTATVLTDQNTYGIYIKEFTEERSCFSMVGIYQLQIVLEADMKEEMFWGSNFGTGIYVPDEMMQEASSGIPQIKVVEEQSWFSGFEVVDDQVYICCEIVLHNPENKTRIVNIVGNFEEDVETGLLAQAQLAGRAEDYTTETFEVKEGTHAYTVYFIGAYGGAAVKANRNLPPLTVSVVDA